MIEVKEKNIGEAKYMVTQMPAMRAVRMQARLLKLLGPSFAAIVASNDKDNPDSCLTMAVSLLVEKLDEKTFETLVLDLLQGVRKDGAELTREKIDLDFAGKLNDLYLVMQFVLEVNFSDFFQEGGIIAELIHAAQAKTIPPDLKKT
jgi:hypothetical protein